MSDDVTDAAGNPISLETLGAAAVTLLAEGARAALTAFMHGADRELRRRAQAMATRLDARVEIVISGPGLDGSQLFARGRIVCGPSLEPAESVTIFSGLELGDSEPAGSRNH